MNPLIEVKTEPSDWINRPDDPKDDNPIWDEVIGTTPNATVGVDFSHSGSVDVSHTGAIMEMESDEARAIAQLMIEGAERLEEYEEANE